MKTKIPTSIGIDPKESLKHKEITSKLAEKLAEAKNDLADAIAMASEEEQYIIKECDSKMRECAVNYFNHINSKKGEYNV